MVILFDAYMEHPDLKDVVKKTYADDKKKK